MSWFELVKENENGQESVHITYDCWRQSSYFYWSNVSL